MIAIAMVFVDKRNPTRIYLFFGQVEERNQALFLAKEQFEGMGIDPKDLNLVIEREMPIGAVGPPVLDFKWQHEALGWNIKTPDNKKGEEIEAYEREKASWGEISSGEAPDQAPQSA